jgi:enoyl-CoA hydratase
MTFENLLVDRDARVAVLTLNRPSVLNALNAATLDELRRAVLDCRQDASVGAVVITGAGTKAFAAGADIRELAGKPAADMQAHARQGQHVFDLIEHLGKPVIAAVNGFALGGGCELALACSLRVAADTAVLGQPEIHLGLIPGFGGTQRLPRLVGKGVALDLLLTGRQVAADEALRLGLVNRIVPAGELMTAARTLAAELAGRAPLASRYMLEAVNTGVDMSLEKGQVLEASLFGLAAATGDSREGLAAFLDKRSPQFKGQ